jgi:hypothetical protein
MQKMKYASSLPDAEMESCAYEKKKAAWKYSSEALGLVSCT